MTARAIPVLWAVWLLAGCASIMPQAQTNPEKIVSAYAVLVNLNDGAAAELQRSTAAFEAAPDELAKQMAGNDLDRARRIAKATESAGQWVIIADMAQSDGSVIEAGKYLLIVEQALAELEAMIYE